MALPLCPTLPTPSGTWARPPRTASPPPLPMKWRCPPRRN